MTTMANETMEAAWNGEEGEHWAELAERYESGSVRIMDAFLAATPIAATARVLDVGCGNGGLSIDIAKLATDGSVLGVDLSSQMLDVAAKNAASAGVTNVTFERADAQTYAFEPGTFDLAVSSFGVMFFDDPVAAFTNIAAALKPGGRISFIAWRGLQDNEWLMGIRGALAMGRDLPFPPLEAPTPFSLADPTRNATLLEAAGLSNVVCTPIDEPMVVGADVDDALMFVSQIGIVKGLSHDLSDEQKAEGLANIRQLLADHATPDGVLLNTAALHITATRP